MARFLTGRLLDLLVVLFGVSVVAFLMIRLIPGDAVQIMLGANSEVTPDRIAALRQRLGLDQPLVTQYLAWLGGLLTGDLGTSLWTGRPSGLFGNNRSRTEFSKAQSKISAPSKPKPQRFFRQISQAMAAESDFIF